MYKGHHFALGTVLLICTVFASYIIYTVCSFQIVQYQVESAINQELNAGKVNKHSVNDTYTRKYLESHKNFKAKIDGEVDYDNKSFSGAFLINNKDADISVKSTNGSFKISNLKMYNKN